MATSYDPRAPSEIRRDALAVHERMREVLRELLDAIRRVEEGEAEAEPVPTRALRDLAIAVRCFADEERRSFEPALKKVDAWGEQRARELRQKHEREIAVATEVEPASAPPETLPA